MPYRIQREGSGESCSDKENYWGCRKGMEALEGLFPLRSCGCLWRNSGYCWTKRGLVVERGGCGLAKEEATYIQVLEGN